MDSLAENGSSGSEAEARSNQPGRKAGRSMMLTLIDWNLQKENSRPVYTPALHTITAIYADHLTRHAARFRGCQ